MPNEYIDINELTALIPYSKRVIEQLISEGKLVEGVHFRRPAGPGKKRIFFWSAIEKWLRGQDFDLRRDHMRRAG